MSIHSARSKGLSTCAVARCGFGHKVKFVGHKVKLVGHKVVRSSS